MYKIVTIQWAQSDDIGIQSFLVSYLSFAKKRAIRADPDNNDSEDTEEKYYHVTSSASREGENQRMARRRAEWSNTEVPLYGFKPELNFSYEARLTSITAHKWITTCGSVTQCIRQSKVLKKEKTEP